MRVVKSMRLVVVLVLSVVFFASVGQASTLLYYDFEPGNVDLVSNNVTDGSGNGYDGYFANSYVQGTAGISTISAGAIGDALHVDGTTAFGAQLIPAPLGTKSHGGLNASMGELTEGTIQFFIRPSLTQTNVNGVQALFYKTTAQIAQTRLNRGYSGYGDPKEYYLKTTTGEKVETSLTAFSDGEWHHIAVTFGTAGLKLYLDQTLVDSDASYTGNLYNSVAWWMQAFYANGSVFDIDNMRMSDVALSANQLDVPLLPGDANHDGIVSAGDYASVQSHFGETGSPILGDANGDGVVSAGDFASVQANYGATAAASLVAVPEPASMFLLGLGMVAMIRRRK